MSPGKQQLEPYGVPVEITCAAGVAPGAAYFDVGDAFPEYAVCFALFLDWGNALILKQVDGPGAEYPGGNDNELQKKGKTGNEWKRIGLARFIWTPSQREESYRQDHPKTLHRGILCHGPITNKDQRVLVTII